VDINKRYDCYIYPEHPDRLYCAGDMVRTYDWASFDLYVTGEAGPLLQTEFFSAIIPD
jgi:hypothetical protein